MDPLSAFALAGTVYTFIDAGITVTKFAKELGEFWKSSRDTTESVGHLTITTQNLEALSSELRDVNEPQFLKSIATDCVTLCQELSGLLDKLRVKDKKSKSEHLSVMFSAYRRKDKISSIEEKLGKLRAQMTLDLLRAMNHRQSDIKKVLDELQNDVGKISAAQSEDFRKRRAEILDLLQACEKNRQQDHSAITIKLREFQFEVSQKQVQNRILQTLRFDGMYSREDNTSEASEGTFRWLLVKDRRFEKRYVRDGGVVDKMSRTRRSFLRWLQSGEGVFHVCGKAGSGKSTLMKLICTNSRTRDGLKTWAGDDTLLHASFFFFAPGEKEARSLTGLYRCVLFTIMNEHRDLMSQVYPDEFLHDRPSSPQLLDLIRPQKLEKAFQSLIETTATGAYKMCIFIDGLDEYEGSFTDYWQLADRLLGWAGQSSGRVKFCVSSRPEVQFVKTFGSENETSIRQIHLQEFTRGDIEKHCQDQCAKASWFTGSDMVANYDKFIERIVDKAEGVFLWAVMVTKVLLYETRKNGFERDLWRRLEEIPGDINAPYQTLFDSMGEEQRRKCNLVLLAILTNPFPEPLNAQSLNFIYDEEDLDQALLKQHDADQYTDQERQVSRVIDNLAEWTRGLVEAISWDQAATTRNARDGYHPVISSSTTSEDEGSTSRISSSGQSTDQDSGIRTEDTSATINGNVSEYFKRDRPVDSFFDKAFEAGRRRLKATPLFRTRVRLFHKTLKDYILHSTSFRKLQSDFSKFDAVETHVKLRLLELGPVSDDIPNSWPREICDYVYEILEMNFGESIGSDQQIPWSICETIGFLIPSRGSFELKGLSQFMSPSSYQTQSCWTKKYVKETSLPHFAAFFGHLEALEARCGSGSSQGLIKDNASTKPSRSQSNLLLSACLGRIVHSGDPVHAGTSNSGTIAKVLDLGYSGHDLIRLIGRDQSVPIWQLLIFALTLVDPQSSLHMPSSVNRLLKILAQLLESESQEEVLILLPSLGDLDYENVYTFFSFITIQDIVESFHQSDSRDLLLRQLNDWPQYESRKPPAWLHSIIHRAPRSDRWKTYGDPQRMSPDKYLQWKKVSNEGEMGSFAVVSKDTFLRGSRLLNDSCEVRLW